MHRPSSYLLLTLLAMCIGFQPVALGLEARCAHAAATQQVVATSDDAHALHQMQGMSGHEGHAQHATNDGNAEDSRKVGTQACDCGCNCAMPGCLGSAPALGPMNSSSLVSDSTAIYAAPESLSRLRAAHGLDLIRPPSRS